MPVIITTKFITVYTVTPIEVNRASETSSLKSACNLYSMQTVAPF